MTVIYTIVGFGPEPFARASIGGYRDGKTHCFSGLKEARQRRTRLANRAKDGITYQILETEVLLGGSVSTQWVPNSGGGE